MSSEDMQAALGLDLALSNHDLGDEVDDGRGRLLGIQLGKQVARVI